MPPRHAKGTALAVRLALAIGVCALLLVTWSAQILDWKRIPGASNWDRLLSLELLREQQQPFESTGVPRTGLLGIAAALEDRAVVFGTVARQVHLQVDGSRHEARVVFVEGDYFRAAGVDLLMGRTPFPAATDAPVREAVISERMWKEAFSARPDVIGASFSVRAQVIGETEPVGYTVSGVVAGPFAGVEAGRREDLWVAWSDWPNILLPDLESHARVGDVLFPLRAGLAANEGGDPHALARQVRFETEAAGPAGWRPARVVASQGFGLEPSRRTLLAEQSRLYRGAAAALSVILFMGFVLWMRLQSARRERDSAIRAVLGESARRRLWRELTSGARIVFPSLALGSLAAFMVLHVAAARGWAGSLNEVTRQFAADPPWATVLGVVVAGTVLLSAAGMASPLALLRRLRPDHLHRSGHARHSTLPLQAGLVALSALCAFALIELAALAGLLVADRGFRSEGVFTFQVEPVDPRTADWFRAVSRKDTGPLQRELVESLSAHPGVSAVALASSAPVGEPLLGEASRVDAGGRAARQQVYVNQIGSGYLPAFAIPLLSGRALDPSSRTEVLVNETFVRMFLSGDSTAVGTRFALDTPFRGSDTVEIVGVVGEAQRPHVKAAPAPVVYQPLRNTGAFLSLAVRASPAAMPWAAARARAIFDRHEATDWRLSAPLDLHAMVERALYPERLRVAAIAALLVLTLAFGATALLSGMRQWILERAAEMAVRRAVGANRRALARAAVGMSRAHVMGMVLLVIAASVLGAGWMRPDAAAGTVLAAAAGSVLLMLALSAVCVAFAVSDEQERRLLEGLKQ